MDAALTMTEKHPEIRQEEEIKKNREVRTRQ